MSKPLQIMAIAMLTLCQAFVRTPASGAADPCQGVTTGNLLVPCGPDDAAQKMVGTHGVRRHGFARVQPGILAQPGNEVCARITLNLFPDVVIAAQVVRQGPGLGTDWVWAGQADGREDSEVVMVTGGQCLSGSILHGGRSFQIRNAGTAVHVVREMDEVPLDPVLAKDMSRVELTVVQLVNQERATYGKHALQANALLANAAYAHSLDMGSRDYFDHNAPAPNASTPSQRFTAAGYDWWAGAENIAAGQTSATEVMNAWLNSTSHRNNILSTNYCDIGVGYAYVANSTYVHYWTQDFGRPAGVTTCVTLSGPWAGATSLGNGWKWLSWYGSFADMNNGWIYHNEHGWMYTASTSASDIWLWYTDLNAWAWTSSTAYPWMCIGANGWYWYKTGSANPRWFLWTVNGQWYAVE